MIDENEAKCRPRRLPLFERKGLLGDLVVGPLLNRTEAPKTSAPKQQLFRRQAPAPLPCGARRQIAIWSHRDALVGGEINTVPKNRLGTYCVDALGASLIVGDRHRRDAS